MRKVPVQRRRTFNSGGCFQCRVADYTLFSLRGRRCALPRDRPPSLSCDNAIKLDEMANLHLATGVKSRGGSCQSNGGYVLNVSHQVVKFKGHSCHSNVHTFCEPHEGKI